MMGLGKTPLGWLFWWVVFWFLYPTLGWASPGAVENLQMSFSSPIMGSSEPLRVEEVNQRAGLLRVFYRTDQGTVETVEVRPWQVQPHINTCKGCLLTISQVLTPAGLSQSITLSDPAASPLQPLLAVGDFWPPQMAFQRGLRISGGAVRAAHASPAQNGYQPLWYLTLHIQAPGTEKTVVLTPGTSTTWVSNGMCLRFELVGGMVWREARETTPTVNSEGSPPIVRPPVAPIIAEEYHPLVFDWIMLGGCP